MAVVFAAGACAYKPDAYDGASDPVPERIANTVGTVELKPAWLDPPDTWAGFDSVYALPDEAPKLRREEELLRESLIDVSVLYHCPVGPVVAFLLIGEDGHPEAIKFRRGGSGSDHPCAGPVAEVLAKTDFVPGTVDGKTVRTSMRLEVQFWRYNRVRSQRWNRVRIQ